MFWSWAKLGQYCHHEAIAVIQKRYLVPKIGQHQGSGEGDVGDGNENCQRRI